jgi:alpha-ribazole phosphatase
MQLILARHGETDANSRGRFIGALDLPLSPTGREQARRLATILPTGIKRCLCSPLRRTRETAEIALAERNCRLEFMPALQEINFGRWEGLSFAEIAAQDQELVVEWQRDVMSFEFPEGEHTTNFLSRVEKALQIMRTMADDPLLIICHGGVIRAMLCKLMGIPFHNYLLFAVKPAALTIIEVDGERGVLQCLNG